MANHHQWRKLLACSSCSSCLWHSSYTTRFLGLRKTDAKTSTRSWNTFQVNTTCKPIRSWHLPWNILSLLQNSWLNYQQLRSHDTCIKINYQLLKCNNVCKVRNKPGRSGWLRLYSGCLFYHIWNEKGQQLEKIKMLRSITWKCGIVPMHLPSLPPSPYGGSLWYTSSQS